MSTLLRSDPMAFPVLFGLALLAIVLLIYWLANRPQPRVLCKRREIEASGVTQGISLSSKRGS